MHYINMCGICFSRSILHSYREIPKFHFSQFLQSCSDINVVGSKRSCSNPYVKLCPVTHNASMTVLWMHADLSYHATQ